MGPTESRPDGGGGGPQRAARPRPTTLGAVAKQLTQQLLYEPCQHPPHLILAEFRLAPECLTMTLAEYLAKAMYAERLRIVRRIQAAFCAHDLAAPVPTCDGCRLIAFIRGEDPSGREEDR